MEKAKPYPQRFPSNDDAVGIELVGGTLTPDPTSTYETVTPQQNESLAWLISALRMQLKVPLMEVLRHPDVSYKNPHEAETARW